MFSDLDSHRPHFRAVVAVFRMGQSGTRHAAVVADVQKDQ
jgi:hypothetical protein